MKNTLVLLSIALAGCGGGDYSGGEQSAYDPASDNHGYGWEYDAQGPRGLKLRHKPFFASADSGFANPRVYENAWDEVQQCTGITGPMPPFVIIAAVGTLGFNAAGEQVRGRMLINPFLIVSDSASLGDSVKHEMVHYALWLAGNTDASAPIHEQHASPLYEQCGRGLHGVPL